MLRVGRRDLPPFYAKKAAALLQRRADAHSAMGRCCALGQDSNAVLDALHGVGSMGARSTTSWSLTISRANGCVASLLTPSADWKGGDVSFAKTETVEQCMRACVSVRLDLSCTASSMYVADQHRACSHAILHLPCLVIPTGTGLHVFHVSRAQPVLLDEGRPRDTCRWRVGSRRWKVRTAAALLR